MFQQEPVDTVVENAVDDAVRIIRSEIDHHQISPFVIERFQDTKLFYALFDPENIDIPLLADYIKHTSLLETELQNDRYGRGNGYILGNELTIPTSVHANGQTRRSESGPKIDISEMINRGIDPSQVLFFRVTQPSETPKPEYYWTTDFYETQRGLSREISEEERKKSITLIANLNTIAGEDGLIQDINDDGGLAVRQVSLDPFDQKNCIAIIE